MSGRLIECVPNLSEGRDAQVVAAIAAAATAAHGRVLDHSLDRWHHRAVLTIVAEPEVMLEVALAVIRTALERIDLRAHTGVHPRIGAADVVPFIPLDGVTMDECVQLARRLADRVGEELQLPVFLYEHAAHSAARRNLATIRAGGLDGLRARMAQDPAWRPDAGPATLHPTAGAVAIGARPFLGAYNIYIGGESAVPDARAIARDLRAANGGLPGLKALGLSVDGQAQVSMNITDLAGTPLHTVFDAVDAAARARGHAALRSEVIGLLPQHTIEAAFRDRIRLEDARDTISLEQRIHATIPPDDLRVTADAIAALDAHEASGTAAALAAVLASATVRLAAGVHVARASGPAAEPLARVLLSAQVLERHLHMAAREDAAAWQRVVEARRLPRGTAAEVQLRADRVDDALLAATDVPLRIARLACDVLVLAAEATELGDHVTAPDAWAGATIAYGAVQAALGLARGNLTLLSQAPRGAAAHREVATLAAQADGFLAQARHASSVAG